jgi:hypothetical protein
MTKVKAVPLVALGALLAWGLASSDRVEVAAVESITAGELSSIVHFLAADEMAGRDTGTPENDIASLYLAHQFEMLGLHPAGPEGGYFQPFHVLRSQLGEECTLTVEGPGAEPTRGRFLQDFFPSPLGASGTARGKLAFVGYGISAPEHSYDDYAGIDVSGRVVIVMTGEPDQEDSASPFEEGVPSDYSREAYKILNAQEHGAAGVILFRPLGRGGVSRWARLRWPEDVRRARLHLESETSRIGIPVVYVSRDLLEPAFPGDFEAVKRKIDGTLAPQSRLLDFSVDMYADVRHEKIESRNVLAMIPGSDPLVGNEIVVVGAHLDHVGADGDRIFNGADDNASGTAGVATIARAFAQSLVKPRRSVLFAHWNAEEHGLLGSRYYVAHPVFSLENTRVVFQMDMIGRNQEVPDPQEPRFGGLARQTPEENENSLHLVGYSRSEDLSLLAKRANRSIELDLLFQLDDHPLNILRRSDSWSFLVAGVPALFFTTGLHPDYHTPQDTPDRINYEKMERVVRLVFLCAWEAANSDLPIRLSEGSRREMASP